jgi:hypothetical protein
MGLSPRPLLPDFNSRTVSANLPASAWQNQTAVTVGMGGMIVPSWASA